MKLISKIQQRRNHPRAWWLKSLRGQVAEVLERESTEFQAFRQGSFHENMIWVAMIMNEGALAFLIVISP